MPDDRRRRPFNARFDQEEYAALEHQATKAGISMNTLLRQFVRRATGLPNVLPANPTPSPDAPEKPTPPNSE